jgi:outer membrane protein assembly factor BamB
MLGSGSATFLAGCQTDGDSGTATEGATTTSQTETSTATTAETQTDDETTTAEPAAEVACAPVSRPETAWPVPRRSPGRDGYVAGPHGFEDTPEIAWEASPSRHDIEHASAVYGQPVVAGETVFVTNELDQGPQIPKYGHVHALAVESSDRRWTSEQFRSPSAPAVWGDSVAIVAENKSRHAIVVAFDPVEGARQWTREFPARDPGFVTAGDHLYLALEERTGQGSVRALAEDGSQVWSRTKAFDDHVNQGPVAGTDDVYVTTRAGRLHALDRAGGHTEWTHPFEHTTEPRPFVTDLVATDCAVFAVVEGTLKAFDTAGTPAWEVEGDFGSLATDGERIYSTVDADGVRKFRALDAGTGEAHWTVGGPLVPNGPPIIAGDAVYLGMGESIVALERETGEERWRRDGDLDDRALANGTLYGTVEDELLALR